jgi:beta-barrel assembly-enhancing protease
MPRRLQRTLITAISAALCLQPLAITQPAVAQTQSVLPTLGDVAADDLSPSNERKLGDSIMREVRRDPAYLADPDTTEYLTRLGYQLVAASPAKYQDFNFFAVRDPMLNAFALPGGYIGVHSGLVLATQSESELAAVVGHEIGHVEQRHIARMLAKQRDATAIAIGALLLALLAARSGNASSGDLVQAGVAGGIAAGAQQQLNFSREAEREADRVGFQILVNAGFEPSAMATFFGRLQQGTRVYESAAPAYLRTHPLTVERMADMSTRVKDVPSRPRTDSLDYQLTRARLRVLQDDSVQGLRDAREYFLSQVKNRAASSETAAYYGLALAQLMLNEPQAALDAANSARRAARMANAPMLDKLVTQARFAIAQTPQQRDDALKLARDAAARYPLSTLTALNYVELLQRTEQHQAAVAYLREQLALSRSDPKFYEALARSYEGLNKRSLQHQATAELYVLLGAAPAAVEQLRLARRAADADFYVLSEIDARLRQLEQQVREERRLEGRPPPPDEEKKRR